MKKSVEDMTPSEALAELLANAIQYPKNPGPRMIDLYDRVHAVLSEPTNKCRVRVSLRGPHEGNPKSRPCDTLTIDMENGEISTPCHIESEQHNYCVNSDGPTQDPFAVDWSEAPYWARYHTVDRNGNSDWWSSKPEKREAYGCHWWWSDVVPSASEKRDVGVHVPNWRDSLRKRPKEKQPIVRIFVHRDNMIKIVGPTLMACSRKLNELTMTAFPAWRRMVAADDSPFDAYEAAKAVSAVAHAGDAIVSIEGITDQSKTRMADIEELARRFRWVTFYVTTTDESLGEA